MLIIITKKNINISQTRTIGISKSNIEFFKEKIINIEKLIMEIKKIEIYTDKFNKEKLLNFENNNEQIFSLLKIMNYINFKKNLSKNKFFKKII